LPAASYGCETWCFIFDGVTKAEFV
jgi:hypothetical protein